MRSFCLFTDVQGNTVDSHTSQVFEAVPTRTLYFSATLVWCLCAVRSLVRLLPSSRPSIAPCLPHRSPSRPVPSLSSSPGRSVNRRHSSDLRNARHARHVVLTGPIRSLVIWRQQRQGLPAVHQIAVLAARMSALLAARPIAAVLLSSDVMACAVGHTGERSALSLSSVTGWSRPVFREKIGVVHHPADEVVARPGSDVQVNEWLLSIHFVTFVNVWCSVIFVILVVTSSPSSVFITWPIILG